MQIYRNLQAKVNDVLNNRELADFQMKVGDKKRQENWRLPLGKGRSMFAVGIDGVNNKLIISDGKFNSPSIEKVYHINLNNETDIEIVRDVIYESEKYGEWSLQSTLVEEMFGNEVVGSCTSDDFETFQRLSRKQKRTKGKGNFRTDSELQDGRRRDSRTQYSLNDKASSEDGVFFLT